MERLELGEPKHFFCTSPMFRYVRNFFDSVFEYASNLDDQSLFESLEGKS
jgi:hypothetical protein